MLTLFQSHLNLRRLILALALSVALITLVNGFYSTYQVQREKLIQDSLENNRAYATKLVAGTENFLNDAQQQLAYAAKIVQDKMDDNDFLSREAERLRLQTHSFNSVAIIDNQGLFRAVSPETLGLVGKTVTSKNSIRALTEQKPLISDPFLSRKGNLLIFISQPIFNSQGIYLGYVGGSLYLKSRSVLNDILGRHFQQDGSYLYVIDRNKRVLYHPDKARIGTIAKTNEAIESVLAGESGVAQITNGDNVQMLAGFYPITKTNWGVVAQRPVSATLDSLDGLISEVIYRTLPFGVITFIFIWLLARLISKPLQQLADTAKTLDSPTTQSSLNEVHTWYFESSQLKKAMATGVNLLQMQIGQLRHDSQTDPLTGAHNRRSLDLSVNQLIKFKTPFSVLEIDIDFFKRINDNFGHDVGDETLITLTKIIQKMSRRDDIVARVGGEEFILILPNENTDTSLVIAERLREKVAHTQLENIGNITVSIGIATWPKHSSDIDQVYKLADKALYLAKEQGRNRCMVTGARSNFN